MLQERDVFRLLGGFIASEVDKQLKPMRCQLEELRDGIAERDIRINAMEKALGDMPVPVDGKDGSDGKDGTSVTLSEVAPMIAAQVKAQVAADVENALAQWPRPKDGIDGTPGKDGRDGTDGVDGKDLSIDEVLPSINAAVAESIALLPPVRGISNCLVDRDGRLVVTFSDGTHQIVGTIIGRDGEAGRDGKDGASYEQVVALIEKEVAKIEKPKNGKDGRDGIGFKDMSVTFDGERNLIFRFVLDERTEELSLTVPFMIYRGIWKQGGYERGDVVTRDGSTFVALKNTLSTPATKDCDWQLCCKRGANGKDGREGPQGPQGLQGEVNGVTQWPMMGNK